MSRQIQLFLFITFSSLTIGSLAAISEKFTINLIDSLLPKPTKVNTYSRPGTITLLSTNKKIIQKVGPVSREKVKSGEMPTLIKNAFIAQKPILKISREKVK